MPPARPLRVLFATAHPHLPQIAGGLQSSTDETIRRLAARGHEVRLLCGLTGEGLLGLRHRLWLKMSRHPVAEDRQAGYPAYRAWHPARAAVAAEVARSFRPDAVVAQGGGVSAIVQAFDAAGVPGLIHHRNVEFDEMGGRPDALSPATRHIANSQFTRARLRAAFGIEAAVIYPVVDAAHYRVAGPGPRVVFVNPHPTKGVDIALAVAEVCPEIPFLFVEAWTLHGPEHDRMRARAASLPNVDYRPRTADMRGVYAEAALMLVPSRWEEAFGRVVAEAQVSGIPAIATAIGGLPEAVGPGGILLPLEAGAADWAAALRALWHDAPRRARLSAAARAHAARLELDAEWQIDRLEQEIRARIARSAPPRALQAGA
jgi:glycosyltransferase involved in cell wall biosynthesis